MVLQNEVGSIVVPHEWRYVLPPQRSQPPKQHPPPVLTGPKVDPEGMTQEFENRPVHITSLKEGGFPDAAMSSMDVSDETLRRGMDPLAKRQLLSEILRCLAAKSKESEQVLDSEKRANRALRMTLEMLQRQNLCLQQQMAWIMQGWPNVNICWESAQGEMVAVPSAVTKDAAGDVATPYGSSSLDSLANAIKEFKTSLCP